MRASPDIEIHGGNHHPPRGIAGSHPHLRGVSHHFKWRSGVEARLRKAVADGVDWAPYESIPYLRYLTAHESRLPLDDAFPYARSELRRRGLLAAGPDATQGRATPAAEPDVRTAGGRTGSPLSCPAPAQLIAHDRLPRRRGGVSGADLRFAAVAAFIVATASVADEARWPDAARRIRALHSAFSPAHRLSPIALSHAATALNMTPDALAATIARADVAWLETLIQCARIVRGFTWTPAVEWSGRRHLDRALESGKGVVLWVAQFCHASLVTKIAFAAAGLPLVHISPREHGVLRFRLGIALLDRLLTSAENRFLASRIVHDPARPGETTALATEALRRNGIVSVTARAWEGQRVAACPFLGNTIPVALAAPALAQATDATLLPVFTLREAGGGYRVTIGRPFSTARPDDEMDYLLTAAEALFRAHEAFVRAAPDQWRGWSHLVGSA